MSVLREQYEDTLRANIILLARAQSAERHKASLLEALKLAEDVLSRFPYSTEMWPNGTHPQTGITQIRDAIRLAEPTTDEAEADE